MKKFRLTISLVLALALAAGPGCVHKSIGVRTDPPGAMVYIDGQEVGQTPVDFIPFDFYGTREIAVYKNGYRVERRLVEINTPWYSWFPLDIVSELILPWEIRDRRQYNFLLARARPIDEATLVRHAGETKSVATARIASERRESGYQPRAYVVQNVETPSVFLGPFTQPDRVEPTYRNFVIVPPAPRPSPEGGTEFNR